MRKLVAAIALATFVPSLALAGSPSSRPLPSVIGWAVPAPVVEACLPATCGWVPFAQLYAPLLVPRILASGISGGGAPSTFLGNGWTPASGTATVTGALAVNKPVTITGSTDATQLKILENPTQTTVPLQVFQSDGVTNVFSVNAAGKGNFRQGADFAGQVSNTSGFTGTFFDDNATATVKALPVAATGWTFDVPTAKGYFFQVNSSEVFKIGSTGAITPSDATSGAAALTLVAIQTYVIDFAAFTAGVNDTSAQAMTGVLMGDTCTVSSATDLSASIGQLTARPTSSGNVILVASGVSTVSTANPASDTFTVRCFR